MRPVAPPAAAAADVIDDNRLMQMLAAAGVTAEQRAAIAQLLDIPGAAAAAAAAGGQQSSVNLQAVFVFLEHFHPQLSLLLQQRAQQVMIAMQLKQQQQQRGIAAAAAPAAGMYPHMMQPTGPAAAAAAAAGPQAGARAALGCSSRRRAGSKKKRDADFYGDSDEECNVDEPSEYEPRLHRCAAAAIMLVNSVVGIVDIGEVHCGVLRVRWVCVRAMSHHSVCCILGTNSRQAGAAQLLLRTLTATIDTYWAAHGVAGWTSC
jgi:hypothetical protein